MSTVLAMLFTFAVWTIPFIAVCIAVLVTHIRGNYIAIQGD